ncbi:T9SS C-terminal target domain-containing protein [candidate division KSB1 bacterium]|nr:MAG: T9SS C-terminal target domain-containing protein [candidate division KSB1 bacterium]MBC6947082.1 T9SS C-terminal target domain-containing protein [candidate division KSB1 bacterium]MCE7945320.1 T9SS C-terminal target domain-containing protein [Chlorobi bacterium CHB1]MDL1874432.1 T9SS type A sorting domain-containing protein [Cytophagia bacterium CHB2]
MKPFRNCNRFFLLFMLGMLICSSEAPAQWSTDPAQNLKVAFGGINPEISIDGDGGCFIVWETGAAGNRRLLRMQHLNRYGYKSLPEEGISLATGEFDQSTPFFLTYGSEGTAIVLFYDTRMINGQWVARSLAQRVDTTGALLWGNAAVELSETGVSQRPVALFADGEGGAFVFWAEDRDGDGIQEMFGNRISADGQCLWGENGRKFAVYENNQIWTQVASDMNDGVFVAYERKIDLYVHHLNGSGEFLWPEAIRMPIGIWGVMTSDHNGGFLWTAQEQIEYLPPWGALYRTRVFRYDFSAQSIWSDAGIAITDSAVGSQAPEVIVNNQGDIIVIFSRLHQANPSIFAQRLDFKGELKMGYGGQSVVNDYRDYPALRTLSQTCLGTNGNVMVVWHDWRMQTRNIYVQLFYERSLLSVDQPVSSRPDVEWDHRVSSDGNGGCIVAWYEIGTGSGWGIFAQQVSRNGKLGEIIITSVVANKTEPAKEKFPISVAVFPNPFSETIQFRLTGSEGSPIKIQVFDLTGKIVYDQNINFERSQAVSMNWDGRDIKGKLLPSGIYLLRGRTSHQSTAQKIVLIR